MAVTGSLRPTVSLGAGKVEVPTVPRPTFAVGYEGRLLDEGDEVELPEAEGKRLVEAGVLEEAAKSKRRTKR